MAEPAPKKAKVQVLRIRMQAMEGDGSRSGEAGAQNPDAGGADAGASAAAGDQNGPTANPTETRVSTMLVILRPSGMALFDRLVIWSTH